MFIDAPLKFVTYFVDELNSVLKKYEVNSGLSLTQKSWLSFCLMAILMTNSVCWARFERASFGKYSLAGLSWMFRNSKIPWELLLHMSIRSVLRHYKITEGILVVDDSDKKRSKATRRIFRVHKLKDKASGGYIMGQNLVLLVLVTPIVTIPVGFVFHMPDPAITAWYRNEQKLKKQGVSRKDRPGRPERDQKYPTKQAMALDLLREFKKHHEDCEVKLVLADALYGTADFMDTASRIFGGVQVISQVRQNQQVRFKNKQVSVKDYFCQQQPIEQEVGIRDNMKTASVGSARLFVCSHKIKRFIIALKYEGEDEYRYLVASDLSWRTSDIIQGYSFRWLVEVFFQDWKSYEGWGQLTKHPDEEGSSRGLVLSLLLDHCLLFHPEQKARLENKLSAYTVGSLRERSKVECFLEFIRNLILSDEPKKQLELLSESLENIFLLRPSNKHMITRNLGRLEPTPSLKYKSKAA